MAVSRRSFLRTLAVGSVAGSISPRSGLSFAATGFQARGERDRDGFLLLDSNENAYGPSAHVKEAIQAALGSVHRYPFREYDDLLTDIARLHKVDAERILLGCGSTDLLRLSAALFAAPGKKVITAAPTFEDIATYAQALGAKVEQVPLTANFAHDLDAMLAKADDSTSLVYICNPNNPTASITPRGDIDAFLAKLPPSTYVLIDEAYHHFVNASARYVSFLDQPVANDRVIVLRTFSKVYGMAGLRLGYAVADAGVVKRMRAQQTDIDLNTVAVAAGRAGLADAAGVRAAVKRNTDDRQEFFNQAMARMLKPIDSHANFVMMDAHQPADDVIKHFRDHKIRIGRHFPPLTHHVRISLGMPAAMKEFWRVWDLMPGSMAM